jgi:anti-sigma regulatory factor (Ser/Thr protein kinase)
VTGTGLPSEKRDAIVLAVGEAVANAIEHGRDDDPSQIVTVELARRASTLIASIGDRGHWQPGLRVLLEGRGRGHLIMEALADGATGQTLIIDLSDVQYIDSAGITAIDTLRGTTLLYIIAPQSSIVRRALQIVGFDQLVPVFERLEEINRQLGFPASEQQLLADYGPASRPRALRPRTVERLPVDGAILVRYDNSALAGWAAANNGGFNRLFWCSHCGFYLR